MYRRILVVVDRSPHSRAAIREGIAIARAQRSELVFFHGLPGPAPAVHDAPQPRALPGSDADPGARDRGRTLLVAAVEHARRAGLAAVAVSSCGNPSRCVAASAQLHRCDLVVAGVQAEPALSRLLGSELVPGLADDLPSPVLVIKQRRQVPGAGPQRDAPVRRVMVLLDDDDATGSAVREGAALASAHGAQVLLVQVDGADADAGARLAQARQRVLAQSLPAQVVTVADGKDLLTLADSPACDIVVVPNTGSGALARLLSRNVVRRLVADATVPVLVCRRAEPVGA